MQLPWCLCIPPVNFWKYPPIDAKQQHGKKVTAARNTHVVVEELVDASFSVQSVSYQGK
jgi:hypothetical protein